MRSPTTWIALLAFAGCDEGSEPAPAGAGAAASTPASPDPWPESARMDQVEQFRADLAAVRHPSDGGGTCRLLRAPDAIRAGEPGRWTIEFTVGPEGIAEGGVLTLMPEPFWGWSTPQSERAELPGYTEVRADRPAVHLALETYGGAEAGMLIAAVGGSALAPGDVVTFDYGAGPRGAYADRHAGRDARLWLGVDGDGDGVRALVTSSPSVDVLPRDPEGLVLLGPSIARPGEAVAFHVSAIDGWANRAPDASGDWNREVRLSGAPADWLLPERVELSAEGFARFDVVVGAAAPEAIRLVASYAPRADVDVRTEANPLVVDSALTPIRWADLHGHSGLSDGTGAPRDYFTYARDTARLDVVALTDHDHFGPRFLDAEPEAVAEIAALTEGFHAPGVFVAVHGYEWTSWIHGHRHVLTFEGDAIELRSSLDERYDTPAKLWDALRGSASLTIAHHSSGQPIPVNWTYRPDPAIEPVTEIVSVHGSSEARDAPFVVRGSLDGHFVRDQLVQGLRLGFIGSGDSHDGHPGLAHLSPVYGFRPARGERPALAGTAGLAAVRTEALTRSAVLAALRARDVYATSGPRLVVVAAPDGPVASAARIRVRFHGTGPLRSVDLVIGDATGAQVLSQGSLPDSRDAAFDVRLPATPRDFAYLRLVQADGATAWIGPFFD